MGYRGDDIDLRTPQAWGGGADEPAGGSDALLNGPAMRQGYVAFARSGPIWVDPLVLDCVNHAFDLALAHRSAEVRIEHLVHAMTRLDAAARAVEARGIRVAALRREVATVVASDIPAGLPNGKTPRRADLLEEVLRTAAAQAYRRNAPATVDDVLDVLLQGSLDLGSLSRLTPARRPADSEPRDSFRLQAGAEPFRPEPPRQTDYAAARLESLEQLVRGLSGELAQDRKLMTGVLQDLQRDSMAQREELNRLGGGHDKTQSIFGDRLHTVEQMLAGARTGTPVDLAPLAERVAAVERALRVDLMEVRAAVDALALRPPPAELADTVKRLTGIEETLLGSDVSDRLKALETQGSERFAAVSTALETRGAALDEAIAAERTRATAAHDALVAEVHQLGAAGAERAGALEAAFLAPLDDLAGRTGEQHAEALDRIAALERALEDHAARAAEAQASYAQELAMVHDALAKVGANQHALGVSVEALRIASTDAARIHEARLGDLERAAAKPVEMLTSLSERVGRMHQLSVERYYKHNRLWYWLYGTDDWVAASWPSQRARIDADLDDVKPS